MDSLEKIEKLKKLLDSGAITEEEFQSMKTQALSDSSNEKEKNEETTKPNFFSQNCDLIHVIGICIIAFQAMLNMIALLTGFYANMKAQIIMTFITALLGMLYIPCGINYGLNRKKFVAWFMVSMLCLIVLVNLIWPLVIFIQAARYL